MYISTLNNMYNLKIHTKYMVCNKDFNSLSCLKAFVNKLYWSKNIGYSEYKKINLEITEINLLILISSFGLISKK